MRRALRGQGEAQSIVCEFVDYGFSLNYSLTPVMGEARFSEGEGGIFQVFYSFFFFQNFSSFGSDFSKSGSTPLQPPRNITVCRLLYFTNFQNFKTLYRLGRYFDTLSTLSSDHENDLLISHSHIACFRTKQLFSDPMNSKRLDVSNAQHIFLDTQNSRFSFKNRQY